MFISFPLESSLIQLTNKQLYLPNQLGNHFKISKFAISHVINILISFFCNQMTLNAGIYFLCNRSRKSQQIYTHTLRIGKGDSTVYTGELITNRQLFRLTCNFLVTSQCTQFLDCADSITKRSQSRIMIHSSCSFRNSPKNFNSITLFPSFVPYFLFFFNLPLC